MAVEVELDRRRHARRWMGEGSGEAARSRGKRLFRRRSMAAAQDRPPAAEGLSGYAYARHGVRLPGERRCGRQGTEVELPNWAERRPYCPFTGPPNVLVTSVRRTGPLRYQSKSK